MTLKELAYAAHAALQDRAGCVIKRSHVHELLAATFGSRSWASFHARFLLADAGVGNVPVDALPKVTGRALQLGYDQRTAISVVHTLLEFVETHRLSCVSRAELQAVLMPPAQYAKDDQEDEDEDADWHEDPPSADFAAARLTRELIEKSPLLIHGLKQYADESDPQGHFLLAALYRCKRPNPYLHEESLKGRVLNAVEQGWVAEYLRQVPRHRLYEFHLKEAALCGVRAAALEYGMSFDSNEFLALAERLEGAVDARQMAQIASTPNARGQWLREAAQKGDEAALEDLAAQGDDWAEEQLAQRGDVYWIRRAAERAIENREAGRAWMWQHLALKFGADLTKSTMRAYHDGGSHNGEFYDSDFGGPLFVDGDEGLLLPPLSRADQSAAKGKAQTIFAMAKQRG